MAQEMRKLDGTLASRAEVEFVMFSTESRRVVEFPEEMVRLFERDAPARAEAREPRR
jgi:acyl-CoA thioesterase FadM